MIQVKKLYKCQKAIIIKKEREKDNNRDVNFSLNKNDMTEAMRRLSSVGFKLYMYCASNTENYIFGLSKVFWRYLLITSRKISFDFAWINIF